MGGPDRTAENDVAGRIRPCHGAVDMGAYEMCPRRFIRGDSNADLKVDLADPIYSLHDLVADGPMACLDAADSNDDTRVDIGDPIGILGYLFQWGIRPHPLFPLCGEDRSDDDQIEGSSSPSCE